MFLPLSQMKGEIQPQLHKRDTLWSLRRMAMIWSSRE